MGVNKSSICLAISCGDPFGVGPHIAMRAALARTDLRFVVFGDQRQLEALFPNGIPAHIEIEDVGSCGPYDTFAASAAGGALQLRALEYAAQAVSRGRAHALVTAPTSKYAILLSGTAFTGQTEYLAELAGRAPDEVTMLFLGPSLNVALATTHVAVKDLPQCVTAFAVARSLTHLSDALHKKYRDNAAIPMAVIGLNPHAGEHGAFGREEVEVIEPARAAWKCSVPGSRALLHPEVLGAETAMRWARDERFRGVVAMTHDQATIAAKLLDWNQSVNVTWGLPYIRTSPDHGVGYEAARSGSIDSAGMESAVARAVELLAP